MKDEKFDFLKDMHEDQIDLFKKLVEGTGNLKNNSDLFYDMQMRIRKAILAVDDIALWDDVKKFAEDLNFNTMAKAVSKAQRNIEKRKKQRDAEWQEGFDAFNGGFDATKRYKLKLITENPYNKETEQYEAWKEGYKYARHIKVGERGKKPTEWQEGFDAFNGGFDATKRYKLKLITENPYNKETEQYEAWKEGYKYARHTKYAIHTSQPSTNKKVLNVVASAIALCFFLALVNHSCQDDPKKIKREAPSRSETAVNHAYKICSAFDSTGELSKPCEVSGWGSTIDLYIDANGREARAFCLGTALLAREYARREDAHLDGWKIRIYSPFSGDNTIAQCSLN